MPQAGQAIRPRLSRAAAIAVLAALATGCTTVPLDSARRDFYRGDFRNAVNRLDEGDVADKDRLLVRMERGAARQAVGEYEASVRDFIEAGDIIEEFERISLSKESASFVINDSVRNYRGAPYERTLVYTLNLLNHLALAHWNDAGVAARRTLRSLAPERRNGYPDIAFARYAAGFCLSVADDRSNARVQYRLAGDLRPSLDIDPATGRFGPRASPSGSRAELVVFFLVGRGPSVYDLSARPSIDQAPEIEVYDGDRRLGRAVPLSDTLDLAYQTEQVQALRKATKTVSRVAIKEVLAQAVEHNTDSQAAGDLVRLLLIGLLEQPDVRRWETLPRWLMVARVPCREDLERYRVRLADSSRVRRGAVRPDLLYIPPDRQTAETRARREWTVTHPLNRYRDTFVSIVRMP